MNNVNNYDIQDKAVSKNKLDQPLQDELNNKLDKNGGTISGNLNVTGTIKFPGTTNTGTTGAAASDFAAIYCEHVQNTETTKLVLEIGDNAADGIVMRKNQSGDGIAVKDVVTVVNDRMDVVANTNITGDLKVNNVNIGTTIGSAALNTSDKTLKGAINEVKNTADNASSKASTNASNISNINNTIGSAALKTSDKTLKGAINEVKNTTDSNASNISTINSTIGSTSLKTSDKTLKGAINEVKSTADSNISNINNTIGSASLKTSDKTLKGAINEVFQSGVDAKNKVVNAIKNNGGDANTSMSWDQVTDSINSIKQESGLKWSQYISNFKFFIYWENDNSFYYMKTDGSIYLFDIQNGISTDTGKTIKYGYYNEIYSSNNRILTYPYLYDKNFNLIANFSGISVTGVMKLYTLKNDKVYIYTQTTNSGEKDVNYGYFYRLYEYGTATKIYQRPETLPTTYNSDIYDNPLYFIISDDERFIFFVGYYYNHHNGIKDDYNYYYGYNIASNTTKYHEGPYGDMQIMCFINSDYYLLDGIYYKMSTTAPNPLSPPNISNIELSTDEMNTIVCSSLDLKKDTVYAIGLGKGTYKNKTLNVYNFKKNIVKTIYDKISYISRAISNDKYVAIYAQKESVSDSKLYVYSL